MPIEGHLLPGETVTFHAARPIKLGQSKYDAYMTSSRLVLYAKRGLFARDDVVSWKLSDVQEVAYQERGLFTKTGILRFAGGRARVDLTGPALDMKQLYQQILGASNDPKDR